MGLTCDRKGSEDRRRALEAYLMSVLKGLLPDSILQRRQGDAG